MLLVLTSATLTFVVTASPPLPLPSVFIFQEKEMYRRQVYLEHYIQIQPYDSRPARIQRCSPGSEPNPGFGTIFRYPAGNVAIPRRPPRRRC
jgi:hypothetical protein